MSKDTKFSAFTLCVHKKLVTFDRPAVMAILNIGTDSFYDGGRYTTVDEAARQAEKLIADGADIIDIGATSSKPGNRLADAKDEIARFRPVIERLRSMFPDIIISVDTYLSESAEAAIECGADIINDISGGQLDDRMFDTVAKLQVPYILMHTTGRPDEMQQKCEYDDIVQDLCLYLSERLNRLYELGVKDVWIDPGFGFGKTVEQNYTVLAHQAELCKFGMPVLSALSRKSMAWKLLKITPEQALPATIVMDTVAIQQGADWIRVHDVEEAAHTVRIMQALKDNR